MKRKLLIGFSLVILLLVLVCAFALGRMIRRGFSTRYEPTAIEASLASSMRKMAITACSAVPRVGGRPHRLGACLSEVSSGLRRHEAVALRLDHLQPGTRADC